MLTSVWTVGLRVTARPRTKASLCSKRDKNSFVLHVLNRSTFRRHFSWKPWTLLVDSPGCEDSAREWAWHSCPHWDVGVRENVGSATLLLKSSLAGSVVKNSPANVGNASLIPWSGKSPGEGNGNTLQYSCLGNPMDRGAWRATVHGVAKELDTTEHSLPPQR